MCERACASFCCILEKQFLLHARTSSGAVPHCGALGPFDTSRARSSQRVGANMVHQAAPGRIDGRERGEQLGESGELERALLRLRGASRLRRLRHRRRRRLRARASGAVGRWLYLAKASASAAVAARRTHGRHLDAVAVREHKEALGTICGDPARRQGFEVFDDRLVGG